MCETILPVTEVAVKFGLHESSSSVEGFWSSESSARRRERVQPNWNYWPKLEVSVGEVAPSAIEGPACILSRCF